MRKPSVRSQSPTAVPIPPFLYFRWADTRYSGAAVFRQRQADKTVHGSGGRGSDNSRPKGGSIVVTKYAPPPPPFPKPSYYPPPSTNAWSQGGPYPPPAPGPPPNAYGQQPPQPYPPPNQAHPYPPPYAPVNTGYAPPVPPPPHVNGGYGPPPPPSGPPYGQYGQYVQAPYQPPPPPPSSYAPPGAYTPPSYPPSYAPPDRGYPQAPPQPSYQGPPAPGYQASPIPPPPPPSFIPGYGAPPGLPPPPGTYPPAPYAPNFQPSASYTSSIPPPMPNGPPDSGGHNNQRSRDRRDRRNDRDRGNKNKQHRRDNNNNQRGRNHREGNHREDASSQRLSSTPRERSPKPSPAPTDAKLETIETEATKAEDAVTHETVPVGDGSSKEDQFDQDQLWDFEKSFVELDTKAADPVGKPLAAEWNDIPTIPPAYNAKCIKSEYYDPDNPDAFLASVRDTKHWPALKRDPVFRFRRAMVVVQFPGSHHEYFTYHCSKRIGANELKEREIVPMPTDESLVDSTKARNSHPSSAAYRHSDYPSIALNGKRSHHEADDYNRDVKRPRNKELDRSALPRQPRRPSSRDAEVGAASWAPQPGEARLDSPHRPYSRDEYSQSPGGYRLQANGRLVPYDSAPPPRNDSGYHSSSDKLRLGRDDRSNTHLSPPPSARARERDPSHERDRDWDRARDWTRDRGRRERGRSPSLTRIRPRSRTRSPSRSHSQSRSRSRSRTAAAESAAAESADDMDDLEYELLGLQRPETRKKVARKPVARRPRAKVNDAFR